MGSRDAEMLVDGLVITQYKVTHLRRELQCPSPRLRRFLHMMPRVQ